MDVIDRVQRLIVLMNENDLSEIEIQEKNIKIRLKKSGAEIERSTALVPTITKDTGIQDDKEMKLLGQKEDIESYSIITSPMVGTFYRTGSPGAEPYVKIGDKVDQDTVVCIIEAMKIMNEVKAGIGGKIIEILVKDGEAVEFSQPLFYLKPLP